MVRKFPSLCEVLANRIYFSQPGPRWKSGKKKSKGKKKKKVSSRPPSPVYIEVQVTIRKHNLLKKPTPEMTDEKLFFQKIIQTYVKTPILHFHFGPLRPEETISSRKYVYFVRRTTAKIGAYIIFKYMRPNDRMNNKFSYIFNNYFFCLIIERA